MREPSPNSQADPTVTTTLSELRSMEWVEGFGVPVPKRQLVLSPGEAASAARAIGFPVVLKLCGDAIAHKSERDGVRLGLRDAPAVEAAARELLAGSGAGDAEGLVVAEQVAGRRELLAGVVRDPQFGACVSFGLGGIFTEALADVVFAKAPLDRAAARRLIASLRSHRLFTEPFRGEPAANLDALADLLVALGDLAIAHPEVASIDLNPVLLCGAEPIAVDALIEISASPSVPPKTSPERSDAALQERFRPLFHPRGIIVAGVSAHPGKFGFVTLHNLLRFGYRGEIFALKRDGAEVLGRQTLTSVDAVPDGAADLVFLCTPQPANEAILRACAAKGVRAAFIASGGYAEAGEEGQQRQRELVTLAEELGMVIVGPNGQGVISTAESMCAQIVAPYPPAGRIAVASQSGNLVSSFLHYAVASGVGVSKAVSLGNSAQTGLADILEYCSADPETAVVLAYVEGIADGPHFARAVRRLTAKKPLVLVKGGREAAGQRAAQSHTGSLASNDRIFDGFCRQHGVLRAETVEEAFEWAAALATQPLPRGRRTVVLTTAGGWGVLAADACAREGLELIELPADLKAKIDTMVPSRWSRSNPIDLAGGETRDTVPELLEALCAQPEVDAVIHLGIGIQSAQAAAMRGGAFFPEHGLLRIVGYHEKQDRRYAEAGRDASQRHGVPVLVATELAVTDRGNAGPEGLRAVGRFCHPSAQRAVAALSALVRWSEFAARD